MHGVIHHGIEPLPHFRDEHLDGLLETREGLEDSPRPRPTAGRSCARMISGVNRLPRDSSTSEETEKQGLGIEHQSVQVEDYRLDCHADPLS